MTRNGKLLGAAALAVALLGGAGVARASIPSSGGGFTGCINPTTGALRVIDAEAGQQCSSFERLATWNQAGQRGALGPAGPAGPAGPTGPQGPAGPAGDPVVRWAASAPGAQLPRCTPTSGFVLEGCELATVTLGAASDWDVQAKVQLRNLSAALFSKYTVVACRGLGADDEFSVEMPELGDYSATWFWRVDRPAQSATALTLTCRVSGRTTALFDASVLVVDAELVARPVGSFVRSEPSPAVVP